MSQEQQYKYFAFISYNHKDKKWGEHLQKKLVGYRMPVTMCRKHGWSRKPIQPIFRDRTNMQPGYLSEELQKNLEASRHLIVICSPNSAKSKYVGEEIEHFHSLGRADNIHFFIVDGVPHSGNEDTECLHPIIKTLGLPEIFGANIHEKESQWPWINRERAYVQIISKLMEVEFDSIWQWHKRMMIRKAVTWCIGIIAIIAALIGVWKADQAVIRRNESRVIAEKTLQLAEEGDVYLAKLLLLNTIPQNLDDPERPLTAESVSALAKIFDEEKGILRGHTSSVNSVAFSPDGKTIVSASSDKTIKIWDVATGKCLKTLPDQKEVGSWTFFRSVSYSPDGKTLVSASWDSIVKIWDVSTGKCMHVLEHADKVNSALYDPLDGKTIVTASWDNTVKIWDAKTENCLDTLKGHGNDATTVSYSPDGKSIVSASDDRTIRIWDAASGNCVKTIPVQKDSGHKEGIKSVAYSPDGKTIVSASVDSTVKIWNALTGECLKTLQGHVGPVLAASYGPDGKTIVSASEDHTIRIWDASTGNCLDTLIGHTSAVCSVVYSPDGKAIASASDEGTIRIWGVSTEEGSWKPLPSSTNLVGSSLGNHQGKIVVTNDGHSAKIWNASTGECLRTLASQHPINTASYSPDGKIIATTYQGRYIPNVTFWDASTGEELYERSYANSQGNPIKIFSASYSPDGKSIVFALSDSLVFISDVNMRDAIGKKSSFLFVHKGDVHSASYSPDGKTIVTASADSTAIIWNASTRKPIRPPLKHEKSVWSAEYSHNGKTIVTTSFRTITLWTSTGKFLRNFTCSVSFENASFSPDDKNIIAYSSDGEIGIWDVASGGYLKTLKVPTPKGEKVVSASYSPDGKSIVVILSSGTAMIRKAPPTFQEMLEITRKRFQNRELTREEKRRFYLE